VQPVSLRRAPGAVNEELDLVLYLGRLQLVAKDAVYSDGDKYEPAVEVVKHLKKSLPLINNVLVLGSGLGSIVHVIRKNGYSPHFTLVEQDEVVLKWAMELFGEGSKKISPVCMDAKVFMQQHTTKYDLLFIDVFDRLTVPEFVTSIEFLRQCKNCLAPGGYVAMNYIVSNPQQWMVVQATFAAVFPGNTVITVSLNKILISGKQP
jgi:spermidine synthase